MKLSFGKGLMAGAAGAAVLLMITAAANGTGIGAVFNLGRTNKVNATSTLTGKTKGPMLRMINSGQGSALNLHVSRGHAPLTVNSATKVANLNASLLGGISPARVVQGGGHVLTAEIELNVGQNPVTLLRLPGYGSFTVSCIMAPLAEVDFTNGSHKVHLWTQGITGSNVQAGENDMVAHAGLGFQVGITGEQIQWTIQDARSSLLNRHVATVQTDEAVNANNTAECDFAAVAYAAP